jgi:serine/threonine protein kinase
MAVDQNLEVPVAIKALLLDNPSALKDEARVLSELRHPNVAGFRQLFEEGGKWYMVIDFVDGGTLRDLIVSRKLYDGAPSRNQSHSGKSSFRAFVHAVRSALASRRWIASINSSSVLSASPVHPRRAAIE